MPKNTSVNLSDHFRMFIDAQVKTGRFGSASEVVREGLRLLEERQAKLETLLKALADGEASGEAVPFDMDEWIGEQDRVDAAA
jgi:antitoxin ParD1/3/4